MAVLQSAPDSPDAVGADDFAFSYLLQERIAPQWRVFLSALADEVNDQLAPDEFRVLLRAVGERMADKWPLEGLQTLNDLTVLVNAHLQAAQWGVASIEDVGTHLSITHELTPLVAALGVSPDVAGGLLEGLYERWLRNTGAGDMLEARMRDDLSSPTQFTLWFGSPTVTGAEA